MEVLRDVQQISCHLSGSRLAGENAFPNALGTDLARVSSGIVGGVGFLIVGFVDCYLLLVVLEEVGAGSAVGC